MNDRSSIKNYIYEKLNNKELTGQLGIIIKNNSIPHTTNQNGTFINISVLEIDHLLAIYNHLISESDKNTIVEDGPSETNDLQYDIIESKEDVEPCIAPRRGTLKLTSLQQKIISFSL
jgi:hypothetical protein